MATTATAVRCLLQHGNKHIPITFDEWALQPVLDRVTQDLENIFPGSLQLLYEDKELTSDEDMLNTLAQWMEKLKQRGVTRFHSTMQQVCSVGHPVTADSLASLQEAWR